MEVIKNILINYWQPIVAVLVFILSFILQIIKKKPINDILSDIYTACVSAINQTERDGVVGSMNKKNNAIIIVADFLKLKYPGINPDKYLGLIANTIEAILSTPQKKQKVDIKEKIEQLHEALKERKM